LILLEQKTENAEEVSEEDIPGYSRKMMPEEINKLPIARYEGDIQLVQTDEEQEAALSELDEESFLGFDTETRPAFKKGQHFNPSLIQLATSRKVFLFQLVHVPLNNKLQSVLSDAKKIKAGVALAHDVKELNEILAFEPKGFVDLGKVAETNGLLNRGLRGLAAVLLGIRISKQAQRSNWGRKKLDQKQIEYAATDAWISRELYLAFKDKGYF